MACGGVKRLHRTILKNINNWTIRTRGIKLRHRDWYRGPCNVPETARRRMTVLTNRDRMQRRRDPLAFEGDDQPDAKRPPLAWTLIWGGTYSNVFGMYIHNDLRMWGYIMWDAVRLERASVTGEFRPWSPGIRAPFPPGSDPRD